MSDVTVQGHVAPGLEQVREVFLENLETGDDLGAGFYAEQNGAVLVDLTGGWRDARKQAEWTPDTLVPVYSTTKPIAAIVLASVIDTLPDGYETRVAEVWPAFGAEGKGDVTIGQLASHQAGLPGFADPIDPEIWLDPPACAEALAKLAPLWPPGSAHGYHPTSWGYLIGELVERIAGRSLGTILREDIAGPNDIDFHIGLPESEDHRIAEIQRPRALPDLGEINPATRAAFLTKWAAAPRGDPRWRRIEIPSANGHGTARAVARLYGVFAHRGYLDSEPLVDSKTYDALTQRRCLGQDLVLPFVTEFAAGVMRNNLGLYGPTPETLCHSGWGGSMALGDPVNGIAAAYVMNKQSNSLQGDPRARRLVDALYGCL